ncbi:MAG: 4-hydroxythreonine-4-phosphate dehydrogenase PdxA [Caldilineaceae bacterium]|nr:4-hydroxythreonine-4-phosphate dehydrogenase PdxA [Caldilineaceae bacterium]MBP8109945.1 4-hydroxythreonine-4-phosphate dehydrogenase PdxA [Caldilineaceae bacterium]MBP8121342.1 4-hydroxythreonine-4-phosphate dehydrogenase PdxA [Caldilineaceae bacterium]MBP9070647.1 4-hydroxythreonine-4-phosphate dehydrogenase PdxA [Caldilineaceae bacterium]
MSTHATASAQRPTVAITMGDPAGIGPELCLRALAEATLRQECTIVIFGDISVLARVADLCHLPQPELVVSLAQWQANPQATDPTVIDCAAVDASTVQPGQVAKTCGQAAFTYIETAIQSALRGEVDAITTAPIHKEALHLAGVPFPGHTEIFAAHAKAERACMMLTAEVITTTFVTTHIGLLDVPTTITQERILDVIELTADAMQRLRGRTPRIAVCGLNPHAGEHGLFGRQEEERIIVPAIQAAQAKGLTVEGPLPPDAAFVTSKRKQVDAYVCMYHDQGHIPFKMLAFDDGVNTTLGLPIVRTSVDHGTAFDIAWTGKASPISLYAAIRLGARLAERDDADRHA